MMINRETLTTEINLSSLQIYLWNWAENNEDKISLFHNPENILDAITLDQSTFFHAFTSRNETYMKIEKSEEDFLSFLIEQDFESMQINFEPKSKFPIQIRIKEKENIKQSILKSEKGDLKSNLE